VEHCFRPAAFPSVNSLNSANREHDCSLRQILADRDGRPSDPAAQVLQLSGNLAVGLAAAGATS
jgi:hypothetical protein